LSGHRRRTRDIAQRRSDGAARRRHRDQGRAL